MIQRKISYNLKLPAKQKSIINSLLLETNRNWIKYPWKDIEEKLREKKDKTLKIVAYGSLVNERSASLTVTSLHTFPLIAFGVYRIFNYQIPHNNIRYGLPDFPDRQAALNIELTHKTEDFINGLLLEVPLKDIQQLRERELNYDLIQVPCLKWNNLNHEPFFSYILYSPYQIDTEKKNPIKNIYPHSQYYKVCREGAKSLGPDFLECWKATTFLSDKVSSMNKWEEEIKFLE